MLISLYKCTFMKDIHEQGSVADCVDSDAGQEKRTREDEERGHKRSKDNRKEENRRESRSTWRNCSDRQTRGCSIKRMMMQASVKSVDGPCVCVCVCLQAQTHTVLGSSTF